MLSLLSMKKQLYSLLKAQINHKTSKRKQQKAMALLSHLMTPVPVTCFFDGFVNNSVNNESNEHISNRKAFFPSHLIKFARCLTVATARFAKKKSKKAGGNEKNLQHFKVKADCYLLNFLSMWQ